MISGIIRLYFRVWVLLTFFQMVSRTDVIMTHLWGCFMGTKCATPDDQRVVVKEMVHLAVDSSATAFMTLIGLASALVSYSKKEEL